MSRLTNRGVPLTDDEKEAIRDDLGVTEVVGEVLPDQSGNAGRFLSTDGSDVSWEQFPDSFEVDYVTLSDTSGLALPDGSLGLTQSGQLVVHDGETMGGTPVVGLGWLGSASIESSVSEGQIQTIADCVIPVNQINNGDVWRIVGKLYIYNDLSNWSGATTPRVGFYLVGSTATAIERGYNLAWSETDRYINLDFQLRFQISDSGTNVSLAFATMGVTYSGVTAGGSETRSFPSIATSGSPIQRFVPSGNDLTIRCFGSLAADSSGADVTGSVYYVSDLKLIREA